MAYNTNQTFETVLYTGVIIIVCPVTFPHIDFSVIPPPIANTGFLVHCRTYLPRPEPRA